MKARGSGRGHLLLAVAALLVAGCAAYRPEPLATSHPAHPDAPTAPERSPSRTLAYTPADVPSPRPVSPVAARQHGEHQAREAEGGASQTVSGEGEVVAAVPSSSQLVLEHGPIAGFMEAMTMGYRVDPPSLLAGLKPGDKVRFTIDVLRRAIVGVEKLQ